jgi:hypothetical protein
MARQAENGFSKFDITKSKAMRNIEDIYDSEPSAAGEPAKNETPAVKQESAEENAPAEEIAPVPSDSIAGPSSSLNGGMPSGMKPLKAEKGVKISLPMEYYFKLVQIKVCTGKSLQDLAAQGVMEFIDRFSQPGSLVNEKSDL